MYTPSEVVDMVLILGECNENYRRAALRYRERFPDRLHPSRKAIKRIVQNLRRGKFQFKREGRGPVNDERTRNLIFHSLEENPHLSLRQLSRQLGISKSLIQRTLKKSGYHPYHISLHQALLVRDQEARIQFCHWGLQKLEENPDFFQNVLFSDEATFCSDGLLNRHNSHFWARQNPRWSRQVDRQHRWSVNVWCGILGSEIIGPYFFPGSLTGPMYADFIRDQLPLLLEDVPLLRRQQMWFQHDGCPAHFSTVARNAIEEEFGERWIGRGGPVSWPQRSPDLTPLDFFLWGYLKDKAYAKSPTSPDQLRGDLAQFCRRIEPEAVQNAVRSLGQRMELCIVNNGGIFEQNM